MIKTWFKKGKEEQGTKKEKAKKKYVSGDTPLGRYYNETLNRRFSNHLYSDVLSYEMLRQVEKKADTYAERAAILEKQVERLEDMSKKAEEHINTPLSIHFKEPTPRIVARIMTQG